MVMLGIGAMIGAGVIVLLGIAAGLAGPSLILAFLLNGLLVLPTALVYAELGSSFPEAGGGYSWIGAGLSSSQAFLSGWISWFAHSVAGSLYAIAFGTFVWALLVSFLPQIFPFEQDIVARLLGVAVILITLMVNYRGVRKTRTFGNLVTLVEVVILSVLVVVGLVASAGNPQAFANLQPFLPFGVGGVLAAMALTFINYEGYEIIVQAGEETRNPRKNIPRAIFLSLLIVVPLYILIGLVSFLVVSSDIPAWQFLARNAELGFFAASGNISPFGPILVLFVGIVSAIAALNATTFSSSRVLFAMSRDYKMPDRFSKIHARFRTPYLATMASAGIMTFMVLAVPITDIAAAANIMFIALFVQVDIAAINIRRKKGKHAKYAFKAPLFPYLQLAGMVLLLFMSIWMFNLSVLSIGAGVLWITIGVIVFELYSSRKETHTLHPTVVERTPLERRPFRILVPVERLSEVQGLIRIAGGIAKQRNGEVVILNVVEVPLQLPLSSATDLVDESSVMIDEAQKILGKDSIPLRVLVKISHEFDKAVASTISEEKCTLLAVSLDDLNRNRGILYSAHCDVLVVRLHSSLSDVKKILLPYKPNIHVHLGAEISEALSRSFSAKLTILRLEEDVDKLEGPD
ncbi:MAG: amino acid permease, partial [Nitrososphaerales archaeon]